MRAEIQQWREFLGWSSASRGRDAALTRPVGAVRQVVGGRVLRAGVRCRGEDVLEAASALWSADLCLWKMQKKKKSINTCVAVVLQNGLKVADFHQDSLIWAQKRRANVYRQLKLKSNWPPQCVFDFLKRLSTYPWSDINSIIKNHRKVKICYNITQLQVKLLVKM